MSRFGLFICCLAAGCSPQVNAPCALQADCQAGHLCVDGRCAAPPDAGAESCTSSLECSEPNTRCVGGRCVPAGGPDAGNQIPSPDAGVSGDCGGSCQRFEACVEEECRQRCFGDQTCRSPQTPICEEVTVGNDTVRVCMPGECSDDRGCDEGEICDSGRCVAVTFCEDDDECAAVEFCSRDGYCEERPTCSIDSDCEDAQTCNDGRCFDAPICDDQGVGCPQDLDCIDGLCVERICRSGSDCDDGQVCTAGLCVDAPDVEPHRIVIVTPYGICGSGSESACRLPLALGASAQLSAMALDVNGQGIPGVAITWSADDPAGRIDQAGLVTAHQAGSARIDAVAGELSADRTVELVVLPPVGEDAILVLDGRGRGVDGARVAVQQGDGAWRFMPGPTHDGGRLTLDNLVPGAVAISVHAETYEQTVLVGLIKAGEALEVTLPLARDRSSRAAGFRARVDFTGVTSQGDGQLSVSGASFPDLLSFDLLTIAGEPFMSELTIPGQGSQRIPMPAGVTFTANVGGFPINLKEVVYARGAAGLRAAWSFAGRVDPFALAGRFGDVRGVGDLVMAIFPMLGGFEHGLVAGLPLVERPTIVDQADIDGDGDRNERVPDWNNFALTELRPRVRQNGRTVMRIPAAAGSEGTILTGGIFHPGTGYTPLGLSAQSGAGAQSVRFAIAPAYGGLEGHDYVFAVIAFADQGNSVRSQLRRSNRLEDIQTFATHLAVPEIAAEGRRLIRVGAVPGAHLIRVLGVGPEGAVRIYAVPPRQGALTIRLPALPGAQGLRLENGSVDAIALDEAARGAGSALANLTSARGIVLTTVGMHATGFSRINFAP